MTTAKKQLPIDTEFDVQFANQIAKLESYNKHHYRPNTYLHKWWARRCGSTFRLILKALVEDEAARDYYAPGGLAGKLILDPMMGGGTTLHEAIRLGANVIGADLDPIPLLQARATLADSVSMLKLEQGFREFYRLMARDLGEFYLTESPATKTAVSFWYTLYGLRRACSCRSVLVIDSTILRHEQDGSTIRICPYCHAVQSDDAPCCTELQPDKPFLVEKADKQCALCGDLYAEDLATPFYARYVPLIIVGHVKGKKLFFKAVDEADLALFARVNGLRETLPFDRADFEVDRGRKSKQLHYRGVDNYLDLFSSRQLLYLERAIHYLPQFDPLVRLNLGLLVSTSLEFNSLLCGYKGKNKRRSGAIRHTFSHHAYSFPYTALENNPLYARKASGTLQKLFQARIRNGRFWAQHPRERKVDSEKIEFVEIEGEVDAGTEVKTVDKLFDGSHRFFLQQGSSIDLSFLADNSVDYIVTDPPYYDSVQYSDLSTYFRVWLRHLLPGAANWDVDVRESAVDPHKSDRQSRYRELLSGIFSECRRVVKRNGRLIFTFHHFNPKAWAALTIALKQAEFRLINQAVVHSENPISLHINKMKSLTHDAILILAAAGNEKEGEGGKRPLEKAPMPAISTHDSEQFCHDCATLLGWMLASDLDQSKIEKEWRQAIEKSTFSFEKK